MKELNYDRINIQKYEFNLFFDNKFVKESKEEEEKKIIEFKKKRENIIQNWDNPEKILKTK